MAGKITLGGQTLASHDTTSNTITVENVDKAVIGTNVGIGTTQNEFAKVEIKTGEFATGQAQDGIVLKLWSDEVDKAHSYGMTLETSDVGVPHHSLLSTDDPSLKTRQPFIQSVGVSTTQYTRFLTANTERMRINSSGSVGIGTSNPIDKLDLRGNIAQIDPSPAHFFGTSSSTHFNWKIAAQESTDSAFEISSGTKVAGTSATADTYTPRLVITSSGHLLVGTTSTVQGGYKVQFKQSNSVMLIQRSGGTEGVAISFNNENGSQSGYIYNRTSSTSYVTSSDYRLKENITEITDSISRVKQLNPSRFNFIADPNNTVDGFIAHEVSDVVPEAITGEKDAVNEDGSIKPQGIDQSKLVPLLTAALQEALVKIEQLETRITELENK